MVQILGLTTGFGARSGWSRSAYHNRKFNNSGQRRVTSWVIALGDLAAFADCSTTVGLMNLPFPAKKAAVPGVWLADQAVVVARAVVSRANLEIHFPGPKEARLGEELF